MIFPVQQITAINIDEYIEDTVFNHQNDSVDLHTREMK